jgi:putative addiction module component (TIGR02574 family)
MSPEGSKLLEEALALPQAERARLAVSLIDSLDEEFEDDVESAWRAEVAHRVQELDEGSVQGVDWTEVRRMLGT